MESLQGPQRSWGRREPLFGIAFVVFFIGSVVASSIPNSNAPDRDWVAAYARHGEQARHLITGLCLITAGFCLMTFLTMLWKAVAAARQPEQLSRVPLIAARVSGVSIAVGGLLMGGISAAILIGVAHEPHANALKFGNGAGFAMVAIPGMVSAALSIAYLSVRARTAGFFGKRLMVFSLFVSVVLLAAFVFVPIAALLIWLIVVTIVFMRKNTATMPTPGASALPV